MRKKKKKKQNAIKRHIGHDAGQRGIKNLPKKVG